MFVNPRGIDKDEETVLTNLTPGAPTRQRACVLRLAGARRSAHRRQSRGGNDRAAGEEQGPAVLHRRGLLSAALPVHRAEEVLRPVPARQDSHSGDRRRSVDRCRLRAVVSPTPAHWGVNSEGQREAIRAYYASITFPRRQRRPRARRARPAEAHRQHDRRLHERPRLLPRRARPVDEAGAVRAVGARAADRRRPGRDGEEAELRRESSSSSTSIRRSPIWRGVAPPAGLHGRSLTPLLRNPDAEWAASGAHTGPTRGAATATVHGLQRPHRTVALHRVGRRQARRRAVRRSRRSG